MSSEKVFTATEDVDRKGPSIDSHGTHRLQKTPQERQEALAAALKIDPGTESLSVRALYVGKTPATLVTIDSRLHQLYLSIFTACMCVSDSGFDGTVRSALHWKQRSSSHLIRL